MKGNTTKWIVAIMISIGLVVTSTPFGVVGSVTVVGVPALSELTGMPIAELATQLAPASSLTASIGLVSDFSGWFSSLSNSPPLGLVLGTIGAIVLGKSRLS